MTRWPLLSLLMSLSLVACADDPSAETATGGAGAGGSDSSTSSSVTTASATTGSGMQTGDAVTITMDSFDVPSGAEVYKCQNFTNPFGGDVDVSAFESHMTPGSHHLLLFYEDGATNTPLEDCSGLEFGPTPYSTQLSDDTVAFPGGVGAAIPASKGFRMQSHYLNTTGETIKAEVKITFHLAPPGSVKDHAGVLFVVQPFIAVSANSTQDVSYNCNIPQDMSVLKTASHMHKHGIKFTSTVAGQPFYETDTWAEPAPTIFDPPRQLKANDQLKFTCTFENNSPTLLTFGESAESNEMCILVASFFPAPEGKTTIDCK